MIYRYFDFISITCVPREASAGVNDLTASSCVLQVWVFAEWTEPGFPSGSLPSLSSCSPFPGSSGWRTPSSPIRPWARPEAPEPLRAHGHSGTLGLSASHEWILVVLQLLYRRAAAAGKIIITSSLQTTETGKKSLCFNQSPAHACSSSPAGFPVTPLIFYICLSFSLLLDFESSYVCQGCFHLKRLTSFMLCVFKNYACTV